MLPVLSSTSISSSASDSVGTFLSDGAIRWTPGRHQLWKTWKKTQCSHLMANCWTMLTNIATVHARSYFRWSWHLRIAFRWPVHKYMSQLEQLVFPQNIHVKGWHPHDVKILIKCQRMHRRMFQTDHKGDVAFYVIELTHMLNERSENQNKKEELTLKKIHFKCGMISANKHYPPTFHQKQWERFE